MNHFIRKAVVLENISFLRPEQKLLVIKSNTLFFIEITIPLTLDKRPYFQTIFREKWERNLTI